MKIPANSPSPLLNTTSGFTAGLPVREFAVPAGFVPGLATTDGSF